MPKRIVVLLPDGTSYDLKAAPTLREMQDIIGGYLDHVYVLDRIEHGRFVFTSMFVHDEGLLNDLPRNAGATAIYQRNVRAQFPGAENPFLEADRRYRESAVASGAVYFDASPPAALASGYKADPWIAGPAIVFEGYTVAEADEAIAAAEHGGKRE